MSRGHTPTVRFKSVAPQFAVADVVTFQMSCSTVFYSLVTWYSAL
jgi:hypothetical protein